MRARSAFLVLLCLALLVSAVSFEPRAEAQSATTIRLSMTMPRGSPWERVARAWANSLSEETGGTVTMAITAGSSAGAESSFAGNLSSGTIDAAMITSLGISSAVPSIRVLDAPGTVGSESELTAARAAALSDLTTAFSGAGLRRLGWLDFGEARVFSTGSVAAPSNLASRHVWLHPGDNVVEQVVRAAGGSTVSLTLDRVLGALGSGSVDTVFASALAVTGLTWNSHLTHVTDRPLFHLGGVIVIRQSVYDGLSADARAALDSTAASVESRLATSIRREDASAYTALTGAGVTADATASSWDAACRTARTALVGSAYSRALLTAVENATD